MASPSSLPLPLSLKNLPASPSADSPKASQLEDEEEDGNMAGERDGIDEDIEEYDEEALLDAEDMNLSAGASDTGADVDANSSSRSTLNTMCRRVGDEVKCSACDFTTRSRMMLQRHERLAHLKKKFFRCVKCNYVTHVKARYTKHVKYHSMPMIKCDLCEFRTPYKWNLDRHLKNHMGGGMYKCSLCNFTAHIKQSLTVHIQNHHLSPEKARSVRRRNKVGASDEMAEAAMDADELELLRLEREADEDGQAYDNEQRSTGDEDFKTNEEDDLMMSPAEGKSASGLKMTFRKIRSPAKATIEESLSDFVHPDDLIQKNGRIYVKNLKCSQCNFKACWESELARHEAKAHGYTIDKDQPICLSPEVKGAPSNTTSKNPTTHQPTNALSPSAYRHLPSPPCSESETTGSSRRKATPRPIPNLIPINTSASTSPPSSSEKSTTNGPTILKIPQIRKRSWETSENADEEVTTSPILEAVGLLAKTGGGEKQRTDWKSADTPALKKKGSSFLDQLAEKLAGNETRQQHSASTEETENSAGSCVAALVRQPNPPPPNLSSLSSRCQHCRQRCKTRADLLAHVKNCPQAIAASVQTDRQTSASVSESDEIRHPLVSGPSRPSSGHTPHPMENKVFVWTRMEDDAEAANYHEDVEPIEIDAEEKRPSSVAGSDVSEASLVGVETAPGIGAVTGGAGSSGLSLDNGRSTVRRVYRCPQCSFWATTASRFHVHMVGHTNTKPFECSQCAYRSNWRWDITKHIKLKAARDPGHTQARVLLLDASGERHYDQYDRYLVMMRVTESGGASLTHGRIQEERTEIGGRAKSRKTTDSLSSSPSPSPAASPIPQPASANETLPFNIPGLSPAAVVSLASSLASFAALHHSSSSGGAPPSKSMTGKGLGQPSLNIRQPPPLTAVQPADSEASRNSMFEENEVLRKKMASASGGHLISSVAAPSLPSNMPITSSSTSHSSESRRTIWKCKRCSFKDHNREMVLQHIRYAHYQGVGSNNSPNPLALSTNIGVGGGIGTAASGGGQLVEVGSSPPSSPQPPPPPPPHSSCPSPVPAFRCGVCNQVSNWKHVIQRHCRLKHNGNIQVIENKGTEEDGPELSREGDSPQRNNGSSSKSSSSLPSVKRGPKSGHLPIVEEDSMGYIMHPDHQQYLCSTCPFVCKSLTDIEAHRTNHKPGTGRPIKCVVCPYFVAEKQEMTQHLYLHGIRDMKVEAGGNISSEAKQVTEETEALSDGSGPRRFRCSSCPYISESKSQYVYHRQFHRPRGAPYKCPKCSYNVSRRHLLNQHLRVHGLPPVKGEGTLGSSVGDQYGSDSDSGALGSEAEAEAEAAEAGEIAEEEIDTESSVHSDRMEMSNSSSSGSDGFSHLGLDPALMPKLADAATVGCADIPLTWVSRGNKFYKMFKCRHCPHVNVRKANIQEHEKRHQTRSAGNKSSENLHACTMCNYRCNNAGVLSAHVKVHQNVLGIIHGFAESSKTDEDQLRSLAGKCDAAFEGSTDDPVAGHQSKLDVASIKDDKETNSNQFESTNEGTKLLHFCAHCPARFLVETELLIHQRFHGVKLPYRCDVCSYTARQENHLLAHWKVHSREYQERTKVLAEHHGVSEKYPQPRILAVQTNVNAVVEDVGAIDLTNRKSDKGNSVDQTTSDKPFTCSLCPAKFGKELALKYHVSLHGSSGQYRCRFCNYAVKAQDNLVKHEKLHKTGNSSSDAQNSSSIKTNLRTLQHREVPLSGLDLALRRREEQDNRDVLAASSADTGADSSGSSPGKVGSKSRSGKSYRCSKCPTTFEKKEQYKIHCNLHGSKHKYQCDKCDYAVKYHANFVQHTKKHDEYEASMNSSASAIDYSTIEDSELDVNESANLDDGATHTDGDQHHLSTAERQQLWLQDKLRSRVNTEDEEPFHCQYCPFKTGRKDELDDHSKNHGVNGATGSYRCNFCDYTVLEEQSQLYEHIQLHFQLKSRVKLESYWKCSNLEIWSEPVGGGAGSNGAAPAACDAHATPSEPEMVFDEKAKHDAIDSDDEDALYIDLSTGQPVKDETQAEVSATSETLSNL